MGEEYRSWSSLLWSFLVPPRPKYVYSPQHPVLKHPQPTFLPQCQRPSFKPIQNNRQSQVENSLIKSKTGIGNSIYVCFNFE
jgi:hypothetical protein